MMNDIQDSDMQQYVKETMCTPEYLVEELLLELELHNLEEDEGEEGLRKQFTRSINEFIERRNE